MCEHNNCCPLAQQMPIIPGPVSIWRQPFFAKIYSLECKARESFRAPFPLRTYCLVLRSKVLQKHRDSIFVYNRRLTKRCRLDSQLLFLNWRVCIDVVIHAAMLSPKISILYINAELFVGPKTSWVRVAPLHAKSLAQFSNLQCLDHWAKLAYPTLPMLGTVN